jgi:Uma2 family endonuclease
MVAVADQPITLEDFLKLPEKKPALEFEDGRVTQKVSPKGRHSLLQFSLAAYINGFAKPRRVAVAFPELRATYAGQSLVPDVSVYRWDRIPRDEAGRVADDFWEPPDVAIEIVSPQQGVNRLIRRCIRFNEDGVAIALLVDPKDDSVFLFRPNALPQALRGDERIDLTDVVPGFELTVREVFDSLKLV